MPRPSDDNDRRFQKRREREETRRKGLPGADEEPLPPPVDTIRTDEQKVGRNDPCPCGSGKKYKQCCAKK